MNKINRSIISESKEELPPIAKKNNEFIQLEKISKQKVNKVNISRSITPNTINVVKRFFLVFEGENTEPSYFEWLENHRNIVGINELFSIIKLKKNINYTRCDLLIDEGIRILEKGILDEIYDAPQEIDEFWVIIDRDCKNNKDIYFHSFVNTNIKYIDILYSESLSDTKSEKRISIEVNKAITNPCFEFWLLLHFEKDLEFNKEKLMINKKISNKHTYCSKIFSEYTSINSKRISMNSFWKVVSQKNRVNKNPKAAIILAIKNSKKYSTDNIELENSIGTSICKLMESILSKVI